MSEKIFDDIAKNYDEVLNRGLAASGETREYFAHERLRQLRKLLQQNNIPAPRSILDYGCGTGGAFQSLRELFPQAELVGTDISSASLEVAREKYSALGALFLAPDELRDKTFDLIFCNGVFHHIIPSERPAALERIRDHLAPSGHFAFFENNPWNPGTRYIMARCPFDRDAQVLSPSHAIRMLESQGFAWMILHSLFYFPRAFSFLRFSEPLLARFPLGGQYLVLCRHSP